MTRSDAMPDEATWELAWEALALSAEEMTHAQQEAVLDCALYVESKRQIITKLRKARNNA